MKDYYPETQLQMAADGEDSASEDHQSAMEEDDGTGGISVLSGNGDGGFPDHLGSLKQLHNGHGYNLAISPGGQVYGTREHYHSDALLEFSSDAPGEVRIRGKVAQMFVAMNDRGKIYAERNPDSENVIWLERYENGYNNYVLKRAYPENEYLLGLKKSGKPKRGERTKPGQKAVRFLPRPARPKSD